MPRRVLFLCTGNSARSQMAEAIVNARMAERWIAVSAGVEPSARVHPLAAEALAEIGLSATGLKPKSTDAIVGLDLDLVITVCDHAAQTCPVWLRGGAMRHMGMADPASVEGTREERLAAFRVARDEIIERVTPLLEDWIE